MRESKKENSKLCYRLLLKKPLSTKIWSTKFEKKVNEYEKFKRVDLFGNGFPIFGRRERMMRIFKRYSDNRTKDEVLLDDAFGLVWCTRQGRAVEANKVKKGVDFDELLIKAFIMLLFCVPAAVIHGAVGFVVSFACCYAFSPSKYVKEHSQ